LLVSTEPPVPVSGSGNSQVTNRRLLARCAYVRGSLLRHPLIGIHRDRELPTHFVGQIVGLMRRREFARQVMLDLVTDDADAATNFVEQLGE